MKFGMFFLGEYLHVITVSYLTVILFFGGGWDIPFLPFLNEQSAGWLPTLAPRSRVIWGSRSGLDDRPHHVGAMDPAPASDTTR